MDIIKRIDQLRDERHWSDYQLSKASGLASSTIANIHRRNTVPSITTLEFICKGFGITLAQFFSDEESYVMLTDTQRDFFNRWLGLSDHQKRLIYELMDEMKQ